MKYLLSIPAAWRPDGVEIIHAGNWRVPEELSEALAQRAMQEAGATKVDTVKDGPPETKASADPAPKRPRGRPPKAR